MLDTFLPAGLHSSFWLEQLPLRTIKFHQHVFPLLSLSTLHLPLGHLPSLHGVLQLPGMCHGTPGGHDPPLRTNLLEPAGPPAGELPSGSGLSAQGEEAGLLPGSGPDSVRWLLDTFAPDELSVAVCRSQCRHTGGSLHR